MVSRRTVVVAGQPVHIFSRVNLSEITGQVAVFFFLHGRKEAARDYDDRAESIVRQVAAKGQSVLYSVLLVNWPAKHTRT